MGILINRLIVLLNESEEGSTNYQIAFIMLAHINELGTMGINDIAQLCAVSKSTVSKFVRELGYPDYSDFRYALQFEHNRYRPSHTFVSDVLGYLDAHSCEEYAEAVAHDILENARRLQAPPLERLAGDIVATQKIAAFGLMFSETAAVDLQTKLGRIGKFIVTTTSDLKQFQYVKRAGAETLIILFSDSGGFMDRYEMIDKETGRSVFQDTKARLVMITANEKMAADPRLDYIVPFYRGSEVHTHREIYPLLTDILVYNCHQMMQSAQNFQTSFQNSN